MSQIKRKSARKKSTKSVKNEEKDTVFDVFYALYLIVIQPFILLHRIFMKIPSQSNYVLGVFRVISMFVIVCALSENTGNFIFERSYRPEFMHFLNIIFFGTALVDVFFWIFQVVVAINFVVQLCVTLGMHSGPYIPNYEYGGSNNYGGRYPAIDQTMDALNSELDQQSTHGKVEYWRKLHGGSEN